MRTKSSSRITDVDRLIKGFLDPEAGQTSISKEKFVTRRHIEFPKELFIELKLKKDQISKVRKWEEHGHFIMTFWGSDRVLFVDEPAFDEYLAEKHAQAQKSQAAARSRKR